MQLYYIVPPGNPNEQPKLSEGIALGCWKEFSINIPSFNAAVHETKNTVIFRCLPYRGKPSLRQWLPFTFTSSFPLSPLSSSLLNSYINNTSFSTPSFLPLFISLGFPEKQVINHLVSLLIDCQSSVWKSQPRDFYFYTKSIRRSLIDCGKDSWFPLCLSNSSFACAAPVELIVCLRFLSRQADLTFFSFSSPSALTLLAPRLQFSVITCPAHLRIFGRGLKW